MFITVTNFHSGDCVIVNSDYITKVETDIVVKDGYPFGVGKIFIADPRKMLPSEGSDPNVIYTVEELSELEKALRSVRAVPAD